jgi:flagellar basal-body rod protein FlgC
MALFGAIDTTSTGLSVMRKWMDAISDNIANANTVRPTSESAFQARTIIASAIEPGPDGSAGGVAATGVELGSAEGRLVQDPTNPLADADGYVRYPDIDMSEQMVQLIVAQRSYQVNLAVLDRVRDAYQQALQLGK